MGLSVFIVDADERSLGVVLSEFGAKTDRLDGCRADVMDEQQVTDDRPGGAAAEGQGALT